MYYYYAKVI